MRLIRMLYVDNIAMLSSSERAASTALVEHLDRLSDCGMFADPDGPESRDLTGFTLQANGTTWRPMNVKLQRFYAGCTCVLRNGFRVSGEEIEVLLGHGIHILGLNRQLACLPFSLYQFIHQHTASTLMEVGGSGVEMDA